MIKCRGSTLIELILSMTAGSGVMLLGISLVHQSMQLAEKSNNRADNNRTLDQLSQCFRRDVHVAAQWSIDAQGTLSMTCSDASQVTYTAQSRTVLRERKKGPNEIERERFALAENASALFEPMSDPVRISLVVNNASGQGGTESTSSSERLDLVVECIPGKWQTLERQGTQP
jgi:type II secretory pathway component PulJ